MAVQGTQLRHNCHTIRACTVVQGHAYYC